MARISDGLNLTAIADEDQVPVVDASEPVAAQKRKKITWANTKAALKTYFDTLYLLQSSVGIFSVKAYGAVGDGPSNTDDAAAIQSAIDAAEAAGGGVVYFPSASAGYRLNSPLTVQKSGVVLVGAGPKSSILCPTFDTSAIITFGGIATLVEDVGMRRLGIVHSGTRSAGSTLALARNLARCKIEDVSISGAFSLMAYGEAASDLTTSDCTLKHFHGQGTGDGIVCTNQSALFLEHCRINGTAGNATRGIKLASAFDGLWLDSETTIETHDNSIEIAHASGSVANIYLNGCALDRMTVAALRFSLSGTASVNGVYLDGVKIFDTVGSGDTDAILVNNSGSGGIDGLEIRNVSCRDVRQRFVNANAVLTSLIVSNCQSLRGGVKVANNYPGIDLQSLAHSYVMIVNNHIGSSHNYGIMDGDQAVNIVVTGNLLNDNDSGSTNNMGSTSASRVIANNV